MFELSMKKMGAAMLAANVGSFKQLAALSGVSVNTISRLNNGGSAKLTTIQALAQALHVDPAELLEEV